MQPCKRCPLWATPFPRASSNSSSKVSIVAINSAVPGDFVKADEPIAKIETDKVTVDILAAHSGVIKKYFAAEGDTVTVGAQFLEIDTDATASAAPAKGAEPAKQAPKVTYFFDQN